ncbi:hypothetical protein FCM35_KLT08346 [Carex littledalei]|uniref:SHSP domain-containing protein n=1 Tax=Carex littledalei TaxID=544730 RepID=A0A833QRD5_9POAL|nr:hypothetical protein FCM35_KLT08346 [Carex littledalei]
MVIELQNNCATAGGTVGAVRPERCLHRLANVFSRVLELPLSAGAAVTVLNFADFYCFFASSTGLTDGQVQPHLIRYHPGTMIKLIVGEPGMVRDDMELNRWRLRLPESTRPELTSVFCKNGILIVIVPKSWSGEN